MTTASHQHGEEKGNHMNPHGLTMRLLVFGARWMSHATLLGSLAILLSIAAGCSSVDDTTDPPEAATPPGAAPATHGPAEPRTEAGVRAAAQEEFDSYSSGDYGGAWDVFSAAGKKAISRTNYQRLFELCPMAAESVPFTIDKVTMDSDRSARVRARRLIAVFTYQFVYEAGYWRFVPPADNMRDYKTKTVQQMASEQRAAGACASS